MTERRIISFKEALNRRRKIVGGGIAPTAEGLSNQLGEHIDAELCPGGVAVQVRKGRWVWKKGRLVPPRTNR